MGQGRPANTSWGAAAKNPTVILSWAGSTGLPMISVNGPLIGWGIHNLYLAGSNVVAVYGVLVKSSAFGDCSNLGMTGIFRGIVSMTYDATGAFSGFGNVNSMHNSFTNLFIQLHDQPSGAMAILLAADFTGSGNSNTCYNDFRNVTVSYDGISNWQCGVYLQGCDSCVLTNVHIFGGNANLFGASFDYTLNGNFPSSIKFFAFDPGGPNRVAVAGTPTIGDNAIYGLIKTNGANVQSLPGVSYI
jgi:hypothetical protein